MIDWHNIAKLLTAVWTKNGELPMTNDCMYTFNEMVFYDNTFVYYTEKEDVLLYRRGSPITKEDVIQIIWNELSNDERLDIMAELLGSK